MSTLSVQTFPVRNLRRLMRACGTMLLTLRREHRSDPALRQSIVNDWRAAHQAIRRLRGDRN